MMPNLSAEEARALGSLLEKEALTPEYYPMTLKGLAAACNQKTSREPVMELGEDQVLAAVRSLCQKGLATERHTVEGRVLKYGQRLEGLAALDSRGRALLTVLLLRGDQTAGELRGRSERMAEFPGGPAEVESVLLAMAEREEPLVLKLGRRPGEKEARWCQLLTGARSVEAPAAPPAGPGPGLEARVAALEAELERVKAELDAMRQVRSPQ